MLIRYLRIDIHNESELYAYDRFYPCFFCCLIKFYHSVHTIVVGDCDGIHSKFFGFVDYGCWFTYRFQKREGTVAMKVGKCHYIYEFI